MISTCRVAVTGTVALAVGFASAWAEDPPTAKPSEKGKAAAKADAKPSDPYAKVRERMVQRSLVERGIKNQRVLDAFRTVPRHKFLPPGTNRNPYEDESIPIGYGQTITAPFEVAFMTEILDPQPEDRIYEVGTGSGFQAAILSRLVKEVYSVEIVEPLSKRATGVLKDLGYDNVKTKAGDGYAGWPEAAPFDAVIVTCSPSKIPQPLIDQLKEGGKMIIPLGNRYEQELMYLEKKNGKMSGKPLRSTLFVPMTGQAQKDAAAGKSKSKKGSKGAGAGAGAGDPAPAPAGKSGGKSSDGGER